jgi:hypothetical protein
MSQIARLCRRSHSPPTRWTARNSLGDVGAERDDATVDALTSEAIAVVGTLAGACVGVGGTVVIARRERQHLLNVRMRDAFGVFLGAMYPAVADLRELPDVNDLPIAAKAYNKLRGEPATFVANRQREREVFGDVLRDRAHRVAIAFAELQVLPLPREAREAIDTTMEYLERLSKRRTPELKAEWTVIYELLASAAELLRVRSS